jgi:hypothetical protein
VCPSAVHALFRAEVRRIVTIISVRPMIALSAVRSSWLKAALSESRSSSIRAIGRPAAISVSISRAVLRLLRQPSAVGRLAIIGWQW